MVKDMTIADVLGTSEYESNLRVLLDELRSARKFARAKGGTKAHPIDKLMAAGDFCPERFTPLFEAVMNKQDVKYSATIRMFIRLVGVYAFNKTMVQLLEREKAEPQKD